MKKFNRLAILLTFFVFLGFAAAAMPKASQPQFDPYQGRITAEGGCPGINGACSSLAYPNQEW